MCVHFWPQLEQNGPIYEIKKIWAIQIQIPESTV